MGDENLEDALTPTPSQPPGRASFRGRNLRPSVLRDRPVVLLDEPFAALGPSLKDEMLDLVAGTLTGALVLMVTHDPEDARRVAPRTILVADGVATGPHPTGALLDDPPPALRAYLRRGAAPG